jgi:flagellar hook-basal body complex protein FliE
MAIDGISSLGFGALSPKPASSPQNDALGSFKDMLDDAVSQVNQQQLDADGTIAKFAAGEISDIHDVMIAVEKAGLSLQYTIQIRNKMLEAYQEIMRMQV